MTSILNPVIRKEYSELKRPDLRGKFICASCGQHFQHNASLNRHRRLLHGNEHTCMMCDRKLNAKETIRDHMRNEHNLFQVFTCGCCNWSFSSKRQLSEHTKCIQGTGAPGDTIPIAKSCNAPGSLIQSTIQGTPPVVKTGRKRGGSLSSSSSVSTSISSRDVSGSPPPTEEEAERKVLFDNAVDTILQSKFFTYQQITEVDTWIKIIENANTLADTLQRINKTKKIKAEMPADKDVKRFKLEVE
ncbi:C2H2-type domain-containing protein [Caenorhabditis elegans]|uniref:C2H2-type domain-containing protein n=1 Tax=Caenorhabditis elegans TaxID=6239 RepID=O01709_CAEEL|nr:C2H2-type domain-containing protein [Caenorhabditis elegans]CAB07491.1 C2H2-type domain-containing protein [Caenorhabditis elegans]|eukprot:NP_507456.1 Zinc finger putative Transcription Factor family [Caenorhabditis elegans]